jgi:hypothetical protein
MLARLDHHPMLTALLALTTAVLVVVVITLATLLIMAAPPVTTSSSESGANSGAAAAPAEPMDAESYGAVYGWDIQPKPAQAGNGADSAIDRHAEGVGRYDYYNNHYN